MLYKNLKIQGKLIFILVCVTSFSLIAFSGFLIYKEMTIFKESMVRNLDVLADAVGSFSRATLIFDDVDSGKRILSALDKENQIDFAALYKPDGKLFANYKRQSAGNFSPPTLNKTGQTFYDDHYEVIREIYFENELVGKLYINANLRGVEKQIIEQIKLIGLIFIGVLIFSVFLAFRFQKLISDPILYLSKTIKNISENVDLSIRANYEGEDELGTVFSGFNDMISQIAIREKKLKEQHAKLEVLINQLSQSKEDAEKANLAKSQFLSRMSHELRTPLNAILGFAQLLDMNIKDKLDEANQDNIFHILKASDHLLDLINEVLDLSKIESGKMDFVLKDIPVKPAVNEILSQMEPLRDFHNINIIFEEVNGSNYFIRVDRMRFKQILINLLSNAIKYNEREGKITISLEEIYENKIAVCVKDTGQGIEEEKFQALFEPFDRLGNESGKIEGTGVGLSITKQLVEMMNGSIQVSSEPGKGSSFTVIFSGGKKLIL
jgi:signal transduction histidine kinase